MSLTVGSSRPRIRAPVPASALVPLDVALVNNMPATAFQATERQFRAALAATKVRVRLHLFTLSPNGTPPPDYKPLDALLTRSFDAVIVTGNEPRAARLRDEPYWSQLAELVEWARTHALSSLWSCLAAHAAVLHLHGIERRPLPSKLSGVFDVTPSVTDPLLAGMSGAVPVPQSRLNALAREDLVANGYRILRESPEAGVDLFTWGERGRFVFLQGHPEYEIDTLAREYRRDVGRFLRGESAAYPPEPVHYFGDEALLILRAFRRRAAAHRDPALMNSFPNVAAPFAVRRTWQASTAAFYRNWLQSVAVQKEADQTVPA